MSTITRGAKLGGGTAFNAGFTILSAEVNTDIDAILAVVNGDIDDGNIAASAGIQLSKLDHFSDDASTARTDQATGDSNSPTLTGSMLLELERLRYAVKIAKGLSTASSFLDASNAEQSIAWQEAPRIGPNLLRNSSFEQATYDYTGASVLPPEFWDDGSVSQFYSAVPTSAVVTVQDNSEGVGNGLVFTHTGSTQDEGIQQTVAGLKTSTRYLVGVRVAVSAGEFILRTVGALAAGNAYQDLEVSTTSSSYTWIGGIIQTDTSTPPTDIDVVLLANTASTIFTVDHAVFCEINADPAEQSTSFTERRVMTDEQTIAAGAAAWTDVDDGSAVALDITVTCPGPGYEIDVKCMIQFSLSASTDLALVRLIENVDGGGETEIAGTNRIVAPTGDATSGTERYGSVSIFHTYQEPVPGSVYQIKAQIERDPNNDIIINDTAASVGDHTPASVLQVTLRRI